jgi:hypothetical protein
MTGPLDAAILVDDERGVDLHDRREDLGVSAPSIGGGKAGWPERRTCIEAGVFSAVWRGLIMKAWPPMLLADLDLGGDVSVSVVRPARTAARGAPGKNERSCQAAGDREVERCVVSVDAVDGAKPGQDGRLDRV